MRFPRASGVLLHPTSLPGGSGIGDLGREAFAFAEFLADAKQTIWQVLPLSPTGYGDSPYQSFSAFAGNPLLISLEKLREQGLLGRKDLQDEPVPPGDHVAFDRVIPWKFAHLEEAAAEFLSSGRLPSFDAFCRTNDDWLPDFALFMAAKSAHGGLAWTHWDRSLASREPRALDSWRTRLQRSIETHKVWQFWFHEQWRDLRAFCDERGIRLFGDLPIYVAHDSADVWSQPELFHLDASGLPTRVAGVPPDYFSATGQLWGNPIYRWDRVRDGGYAWWIRRFRSALQLFDMLRLDHFRGFQAYWEVPAGEPTAKNGRWVNGPGAEFFAAVTKALGDLPIVAENLGVITPEVESIRRQFGYPGMAILQFAFGNDPQAPTFRPHNYDKDLVAYTGTHDNDTAAGWWSRTDAGADSIRTVDDIAREHAFARAYLGCDAGGIHWAMIRAVLASVANTAITPMQDLLGFGSDARMNLPGRPDGNWRWRLTPGQLTEQTASRLRELTVLYDRDRGDDA